MILLTSVLVFGAIFVVKKYYDSNYDIWFPSYWKQYHAEASDADKREGPLHIVLLLVDHFEPGGDIEYLHHWIEMYQKMMSNHKDSYGNHPQRTFSYPIEQFDSTEIEMILSLCRAGFGEVELQLHHFDDNSESVREEYQQGLVDFKKFGICQTIDSQTSFSLVHGNWALDNSQNQNSPNPCGVNDEIKILASLGCYLDVTFPAITTTSQPKRINSIYYATDQPDQPKSYDDGIPVRVGGEKNGDLMMLQGPLMINWSDWRFRTHPSIENGDIFKDYPLFPERIPLWLEANIHVEGQPNWVFVKLHSHGCHKADSLAIWGNSMDTTLAVLESEYNDGVNYILHYATTREAYNIIKAAEAGKTGDPNLFLDYIISPYQANQLNKNN